MTAVDVSIHAGVVTLLALGVWLLTRVWRNPHVGRALWLAVLLKLVCPPIWAVNYERAAEPPPSPARQEGAALDGELFARSEPVVAVPPEPIASPPPIDVANEQRPHPAERPLPDGRGSKRAAPAAPIDFMTLSAVAWAVGALLVWLSAAVRSLRFVRSIRRLPDGDERLTALLTRSAARMKVRPPRLKTSDDVGPLLWAVPFRRATVVVPAGLFDALPDDRAEALLAHECAHLARRDHWVRWLELCVCGLWWWLPTAWLAAAAGRRCEELCCDAAVLAAGDSSGDHAAAYAEGLLAAAEYLSKAKRPPIPLPASGVGRSPFLKRRFEMILSDRLPRRPGRGVRTLLGGLAAGAVLVGVSFAQPPGEAVPPNDDVPPADSPADRTAATTTPASEVRPAGEDAATAGENTANGDASFPDATSLPGHVAKMNEYLRKDAPDAPPLTVEEVDAAVARALRESTELEPADMESLRRLFDGGTWRTGTRFYLLGGPLGSDPEITLVVKPAEGELESRVVVRDGARPADEPLPTVKPLTLAEAVATYNATAEGQANPVTFEQVAEAVRNAMGDGGARRQFAWVFGIGEPPPTAKVSVTPGLYPGKADEFPVVTISNSDDEFALSSQVKNDVLSAATRAKIAAALAAAAEDEELPVATRLKLLRESVEPGALTPDQNAALFAEFVAGKRREEEVTRRANLARAGLGGEEPSEEAWEPVNQFYQEKEPLIETMAALHATAPDADAAYFVALLGAEWRLALTGGRGGGPHTIHASAVTVLNRTAETAEGLRVVLKALDTPEPTLPEEVPLQFSNEERQAENRRLDEGQERAYDQLRGTVRDHRAAIELLLKTVRSARPATDAAAGVLLDAAASDDPQLRAAAVEALAGAGG